jgi:hypothetical protein
MRRLSDEAYLERNRQNTRVVDKTKRTSSYRAGLDVTGYTGFIPGKYADNVFGRTFANANFASQNLKRKQNVEDPMLHDAYVEKVLRAFERVSPSSKHGNFPLYRESPDQSHIPRESVP